MVMSCSLSDLLLTTMQVALHDMRNLTKQLHVFDHHAEEVFQVCAQSQRCWLTCR